MRERRNSDRKREAEGERKRDRVLTRERAVKYVNKYIR